MEFSSRHRTQAVLGRVTGCAKPASYLELDLAQQRGFIEYIREQRLKQLKKGMKK